LCKIWQDIFITACKIYKPQTINKLIFYGIIIACSSKKNMKKSFFALMLVAAASATAQNSNKKTKTVSAYKPHAGTVTAEFGLSGGLLNTNVNLNNNAGLLRFRYFVNDDLAVRIGFGVSSKSTTDNYYGGSNNSQAGSRERKNSGITFNLGLEKHLTGTERLSTYVGADLIVALNGASEKWDNSNGTGYVQGLSREIKGFNTVNGGTNAATGFGLRLVAGGEYYIVKNVYLGAELGFGFVSSKFKDITDKTTNGAITTANDRKSPGKDFEISPSVITGVRIGFQF
jgi:hypothetical protein